jgi:hypothetical protein
VITTEGENIVVGVLNYCDRNILVPDKPEASGLPYSRHYKSIYTIEAINNRSAGN